MPEVENYNPWLELASKLVALMMEDDEIVDRVSGEINCSEQELATFFERIIHKFAEMRFSRYYIVVPTAEELNELYFEASERLLRSLESRKKCQI